MKPFFLTLILINALVIRSVSAQKVFCNASYTLDSAIVYNPVLPYDSGTQVFYNVGLNGDKSIFDSLSSVIPIGFNFNFYGNDYNSLLISPNGYLTFDTALAGMPSANCHNVTNSILLFATVMDPEIFGSVKYTTIGTSPNRQFVVSFDSVAVPVDTPGYFDWSYCTGQVVLYETTSIIETYISHGTSSVYCENILEGVENADGTSYLYGSSTDFGSVQNNSAVRFIQNNLPGASIPICIVGVDSATNKNMVVWNKPAGIPVDSFIIYRETNVSGVYAQIGAQPYSIFSTFIDTSSNPAQQANRYKLGYRDSCGVVGVQSNENKTVHLSINQGQGNTWNLQWDAYEGDFSFGSYFLYRGTSTANMILLDSIASTLYSYTDLNPPTGTVYYVIGVENPGSCTPARIASGGSFSNSLSNIVTANIAGVPTLIDESSITIFPNPVDQAMNVQFKLNAKTNLGLIMNDITGRVVYSVIYKDIANLFDQKIDCSNLSHGVYFLQIKTEGGNYNKKIVVE